MYQAEQFITELDQAIVGDDSATIVRQVERLLTSAVRKGLSLPPRYFEATSGSYARRLLHNDPSSRFSVVVMAWGVGQGTPLHDHDNHWCVEGVLQGRVEIVRFSRGGSTNSGTHIFREEESVFAGVGEAGHLIPPFEHHVIRNASDTETSVTIHVYEGFYEACSVFVPVGDGSYREERKQMTFIE